MHAYIITGGSGQIRLTHIRSLCDSWQISHSDVVTLSIAEGKHSIGVKDVLEFTGILHIAPNGKGRVGIISQAHALTAEAQQTLLKTLEEPPGKSRIILESDSKDTFLPTILSRCEHIAIVGLDTPTAQEESDVQAALKECEQMQIGGIINMVSTRFSKKEDAVRFLRTYLFQLHRTISSPKTTDTRNAMRAIRAGFRALTHLRSNTSPLMVMDAFFFKIFLDKGYPVVYNDF